MSVGTANSRACFSQALTERHYSPACGSSMSRTELKSLVAWLRDCAARTARGNRADLGPVHNQLRIINALAREILVLARTK
jgi:hypothetical protein